jgi:hypothetical protein
MMKSQFVLIFLVIACVCHQGQSSARQAEKTKQWPYKDFVYVKAYLYNLENELFGNHAIIKRSKSSTNKEDEYVLDGTVVGEGVLLDKRQVETIVTITNKDVDGLIEGLSKSYIPHHAFVFYDNDHKPAAYITLCFDCEALRVFPEKSTRKTSRELSDTEIEKLLEFLEQYKRIIMETGLPILDSPFQYREYGKLHPRSQAPAAGSEDRY